MKKRVENTDMEIQSDKLWKRFLSSGSTDVSHHFACCMYYRKGHIRIVFRNHRVQIQFGMVSVKLITDRKHVLRHVAVNICKLQGDGANIVRDLNCRKVTSRILKGIGN